MWFKTKDGRLLNLTRADAVRTKWSAGKSPMGHELGWSVMVDYGEEAYFLAYGLPDEAAAQRVVDHLFENLASVGAALLTA